MKQYIINRKALAGWTVKALKVLVTCHFSLIVLITYHLSLITSPAQGFLKLEQDSVPFFKGFAVGFDVAGAAQLQLGDYGQLEASLRLNLHDQYFPIVELGYGRANHENDEVTGITYRTKAPYFRLGADVNLMKRKHTGNRIFAGLRYGFTSYKVDLERRTFPDPIWKWDTSYGVKDESCYQHWAELVLGIDAKVAGPIHLGWSVRYRRRLAHDDGLPGKTWYVPGYGTQESSRLGYTFNAIIDI